MVTEAFRALAHEHRRRLLIALFERTRDTSDPVIDVSSNEFGGQEFQTSLIHMHVPLLEDKGFVQWDRDTNRVSPGPDFGRIEPFLEQLGPHSEGALSGQT